ncbi:MAG: hypothetical protein MRK02_18055 [Candidatus Scalindua sp.]|nr:hypothetical protein [Candidatus Scalindua sp.]
MNTIKVRLVTTWILVVLGSGLTLFSLLGNMTIFGNYQNSKSQKWNSFDSSLPPKTLSLKSLQTYAADRIDDEFSHKKTMDVLSTIVMDRFTHGDQARYNIFSNWLLYFLGCINPAFELIHDPDVLLRNGYSALCSEQAYLLLILAERFGIRARHVGLNGHVVMEAWYGDDWHMYDPDLEVVPEVSGRGVLSVEALSREPSLIKTLYQGRGTPDYVNHIIKIFTSREDNTFMSLPRFAHFEWKTNVLYHFEQIANWLKWIIPLFMLASGVLIQVRSR